MMTLFRMGKRTPGGYERLMQAQMVPGATEFGTYQLIGKHWRAKQEHGANCVEVADVQEKDGEPTWNDITPAVERAYAAAERLIVELALPDRFQHFFAAQLRTELGRG